MICPDAQEVSRGEGRVILKQRESKDRGRRHYRGKPLGKPSREATQIEDHVYYNLTIKETPRNRAAF